MEQGCPRCQNINREGARFCARCGLSLGPGVDGTARAGTIRVAQPLAVPPDYLPVVDAAHLYFRWESSLGGDALLGTEGVRITIFNAGYALRDLVFCVEGLGRGNELIFSIEELVRECGSGASASIEVPSYRIENPMRMLTVRLVSAEFAAA